MSNLTEQWKKGEIPEGFYYVKSNWSDAVEVRYVHNGIDDWKEVLAPVPSYEEYNRLKEVERKKGKLVNVNYKIKQENQQLKDLLKECQNLIAREHRIYEEIALIEEIDNAIGEK